jgi:hypothetical protein
MRNQTVARKCLRGNWGRVSEYGLRALLTEFIL